MKNLFKLSLLIVIIGITVGFTPVVTMMILQLKPMKLLP